MKLSHRQCVASELMKSKANKKKTPVPVGSGVLLGDFVYRTDDDQIMRIQDAGSESFDVSVWNGCQWNFVDNISSGSAKIRLNKSWEVYARIVT
jgi:hypothetical protein